MYKLQFLLAVLNTISAQFELCAHMAMQDILLKAIKRPSGTTNELTSVTFTFLKGLLVTLTD